MNFDSKNFLDLETAALEKADRRQINFIYLFSKDVCRMKDDRKIWKCWGMLHLSNCSTWLTLSAKSRLVYSKL